MFYIFLKENNALHCLSSYDCKSLKLFHYNFTVLSLRCKMKKYFQTTYLLKQFTGMNMNVFTNLLMKMWTRKWQIKPVSSFSSFSSLASLSGLSPFSAFSCLSESDFDRLWRGVDFSISSAYSASGSENSTSLFGNGIISDSFWNLWNKTAELSIHSQLFYH